MTKLSLISMLAVLPLFAFADSVEDCEVQKIAIYTDLQNINLQVVYSYSEANSIYRTANTAQNNLGNLSSNISGSDSQTILAVQGNLESIKSVASVTSNRLESVMADLLVVSNRVSSIDCASCTSENGGLGCCDVISNIWLSVSNIHYNTDISLFILHSISNDLKSIVSILRANTNLLVRILDEFTYQGGLSENLYYRGMYYDLISFNTLESSSVLPDFPFSIAGDLNAISFNLADSLPSLNNYFYHYIYNEFSPFADHMTHNLITLTDSSTNFFSLFQAEPVLSDYWKFPSTVRREVSYYQFLTNHYIAVSQGEQFYDYQGVSVEITKTNWMDRIEALIAAIVFNDGGAVSNTVNTHYEQEDPDGLMQTMSEAFTDLENDPQSALSALRDTSQSLVSSISRFSSAFHDASMPGTVRLVNFGASSPSNRSADSSAASADSVEFSTSDGSTFFEMCRCATTIAWTLGGLILVVVFLSWASKTSYKMFIFCWDVFNGIFGK